MSNNLGFFETCSKDQKIHIEHWKHFIYLKTYQKKSNGNWVLVNITTLTQDLANLITNYIHKDDNHD